MNNFFWRRNRNAEIEALPAFSAERGRAPRILVESRDLAERWAIEVILRRAGFEPASCGGPEVLPGGRCPLVAGSGCPAFTAADAVFCRLDLADAANEQILQTLKSEAGRRRVVVEVPSPRARKLAGLLEGCVVLPMPATSAAIVEAFAGVTGAEVAA